MELLSWGGPATLHALCLAALPTTARGTIREGERVAGRSGRVAMLHRLRAVDRSSLAAELRGELQDAGVMDFTSLLEAFAFQVGFDDPVVPPGPPPDTVLVDEAQDLNPLQWLVVEKIMELSGASKLVVAGDDDQAIMEFQGAEVSNALGLLNLARAASEVRVLDRSHRLRPDVVEEAKVWASRIRDRFPKVWGSGNTADGPTLHQRYASMGAALGSAADWPDVVLCRSSRMVDEVANVASAWGATVECVTGEGRRVVPAGPSSVNHSHPNHNRLLVMTIHQSKGREWGDVWLYMGMPRASRLALLDPDMSDAEHRVWYVGLTRSYGRTTLVFPPACEWYPT